VEGAANEAILELLAGVLDLPRRAITLVAGDRGRAKRVRIEGLTMEAIRARLDL
jgi:uncharacterized protein YggU (UPF0235/DUF167 family)